jgi:hypothetical protein
MLFRLLLMLHRWVGVALCVLFLLWFPSGIGMMYWGMPAVTARDRLERWPALDPAKLALSPQEAAERAGVNPLPSQVRLNSYDGRPVYRLGGGGRDAGGERGGGDVHIVYADTGEEQGTAPLDVRDRAAAAWTGRPVSEAFVEPVTEIDQWMVGNQLRNLRPLWKYSWPNGEQLYIGDSGEVLMYTTSATRLQAYLSAIPHWLYFTPLRKHQPFWIRLTTYSAMVGTAGAIIGVVIGVWLYSPRKRYRFAGAPSRLPYRGQKRWHTIFGLIFGLATITWTISGSLAFLPFPTPQRAPTDASQLQEQARQLQGQRGQRGQRGQGQGQQGQGGQRGRRGGDGGLANALRGQTRMADFAEVHPRDVLARLAGLNVKELEFRSFAGQPVIAANLGDGTSKLISLEGLFIHEFDRGKIVDIVKKSAADPQNVETRTVDQYDYYYLDRTRRRPLPVILALMHDADQTRYYIDPKTASIVGTYNERNSARRFFYSGLHSLSFPWLYNYRPLWDIIVIAFMIGGTALCVTSLLLAWRVLGRKLRRIAGVAVEPASALSEDLA